jgi:hypothetical protein
MSGAYELFHVNDEATVDMALELVEAAFPDCHPWLPEESRAEYVLRFGVFHIVFKDGKYVGFFAIMTDEDGAFVHLGTTGGRYAIKDMRWCLPKVQSIAANVYGITELFCELAEGHVMHKIVSKLGFTKESALTYKIKYHGKQ